MPSLDLNTNLLLMHNLVFYFIISGSFHLKVRLIMFLKILNNHVIHLDQNYEKQGFKNLTKIKKY